MPLPIIASNSSSSESLLNEKALQDQLLIQKQNSKQSVPAELRSLVTMTLTNKVSTEKESSSGTILNPLPELTLRPIKMRNSADREIIKQGKKLLRGSSSGMQLRSTRCISRRD